jgi:hypothetical protein
MKAESTGCTESSYDMTQTPCTSGIANVGMFRRVKTKELKNLLR